jgi:hypothetical protein
MASSTSVHLQKRRADFVVAYLAALAAMLLIYLVTERNYFADGRTDFAVLGYVAPRAAAIALLPGLIGAWLVPGRRLLQVVLGLVGGPLFGWVAINLVHIYGVLS